MKKAEKLCRKFKKGAIPWSPGLSMARNKIIVWMLVIRRIRGCAVCAKTIIRRKIKAGMRNIDTVVTMNEAQNKLRQDECCRMYIKQ